MLSFYFGEQCGQSNGNLGDCQCVNLVAFVQMIDSGKLLQRIFCKLLCDTELDDLIGAERFDQLGRRAECDHFSVVHDRDAIAETRRLFHVVRRQENRAAARAKSLDDVPERQPCSRTWRGARWAAWWRM